MNQRRFKNVQVDNVNSTKYVCQGCGFHACLPPIGAAGQCGLRDCCVNCLKIGVAFVVDWCRMITIEKQDSLSTNGVNDMNTNTIKAALSNFTAKSFTVISESEFCKSIDQAPAISQDVMYHGDEGAIVTRCYGNGVEVYKVDFEGIPAKFFKVV